MRGRGGVIGQASAFLSRRRKQKEERTAAREKVNAQLFAAQILYENVQVSKLEMDEVIIYRMCQRQMITYR